MGNASDRSPLDCELGERVSTNESPACFEIESLLITPIEGTGRWVELGPKSDEQRRGDCALDPQNGRSGRCNHERSGRLDGATHSSDFLAARSGSRCVGAKSSERFGNQHMERIGRLTRLEAFDLTARPIDDSGLSHVAQLTNLRQLWLPNTLITDAGLEHLRRP